MLPDMEKLYQPYAKDADLKTSLLYWQREAEKLGIPENLKDQAIAETFLEMANGKAFPVGTCDCGCDFPVEWSCVALNHYVLKKMVSVKEDMAKIQGDILNQRITKTMLDIIERQNAEYIAENTKPPKPFFDWSKSGTVRLYKKIRGK